MKALLKLSALSLLFAFVFAGCEKDDNHEITEPPITVGEFFSGSWLLESCITDNQSTPCGTVLYPFIIHSEFSRDIDLITRMDFDTINNKLVIFDCNEEEKIYGAFIDDFFSQDLFRYDSTTNAAFQDDNLWHVRSVEKDGNGFTMELITTYVWASMSDPNEEVDITHICEFKKLSE